MGKSIEVPFLTHSVYIVCMLQSLTTHGSDVLVTTSRLGFLLFSWDFNTSEVSFDTQALYKLHYYYYRYHYNFLKPLANITTRKFKIAMDLE